MKRFANMFLILFLADAGFSLVDELVSLLTPLMPFASFRNLLAGTVIMMAVPLYICLGVDRRLPKRVFLPLIAFILWTLVSTWLFPVLGELKVYGFLMAMVQTLLGMLPLVWFRNGGQPCLTMPAEEFDGPFFSTRNSLIFFAVNLLVVPLVLVIFSLSVVDAYMSEYTSGFMHLRPGGLKMTERVYTRDNRTIRLAAMIHVGNREYYQQMASSIATGRTIVLAEGVSDDRNQLKNRLDYGKVAEFIGLSTQDRMLFKGRLIDEIGVDGDEPTTSKSADPAGKLEPDILRADVDMSSFRPTTIQFLDAIGKHLRESRSFAGGVMAINRWAEKNVTPEMYDVIMDDILHRRNLIVLGHLDRALAKYDTVVIPWGALHMKEIEENVLKRGFVLQNQRERVSIDSGKLLQERL